MIYETGPCSYHKEIHIAPPESARDSSKNQIPGWAGLAPPGPAHSAGYTRSTRERDAPADQ